MGADQRVRAGVEAFTEVSAGRRLGVDGLHVYVEDQPPIERHWMADLRRDVFSVSKTFTSVAVGIAEAKGLLDLTDSVLAHLPQLAPTAAPGVEGSRSGNC